jgi:hypothetical protein
MPRSGVRCARPGKLDNAAKAEKLIRTSPTAWRATPQGSGGILAETDRAGASVHFNKGHIVCVTKDQAETSVLFELIAARKSS